MELKKWLQILRHWLWLIVLIVVVFAVFLTILLFTAAPKYQARTQIGLSTLPDRQVAAFLEVLQAKIVQEQTIDQLGLLGEVAVYDLDVKDLGNAGFLELTVTSGDSNMAALIANTHTDVAIAYYNLLQTQPAEEEKEALSEQLQQAQEDLDTAEQSLAEFKSEHGIGSLSERIIQYEEHLGILRSERDQRLLQNLSVGDIDGITAMRQQELINLTALAPLYNKREAAVTRAERVYNQVHTKYIAAELAVTAAQVTDDIQPIERAQAPAQPVSVPKKQFAVGLFCALGLGIGLAFVLESVFPSSLTPEVQKNKAPTPDLGLSTDKAIPTSVHESRTMSAEEGKIRIWLLSRLYYPNFSGAAIQGHYILRALVNHGFKVTILTAADLAARDLKGSTVTLDGLDICYLPVIPRQQPLTKAGARPLQAKMSQLNMLASNLSLSLQSSWILWRQGHSGDIVHLYACNEFSFLVTSLARARGMHPVISMTLLGFDDPASIARNPGKWQRTLKMRAFHLAEVLVGYSTAQTDSARSAGFDSRNVIRIPGGVDLTLYHPVNMTERNRLCKMLGLNEQKRYIVFVGSAIHRKGIDVLVKAFIMIAKQMDDVQLLIVGPCNFDDPKRYAPSQQELIIQLTQELTEAGYTSRVHWTGKRDNVHEYLQVSSIFCFPTRQEGFGIVTAEAMAVGLPVVVSRLEGVTTDLVEMDQVGVLINGHQPADYAEALLWLLSDPTQAQRMGDAARTRAISEYDLEIAVQRYAQLYRGFADVTDS